MRSNGRRKPSAVVESQTSVSRIEGHKADGTGDAESMERDISRCRIGTERAALQASIAHIQTKPKKKPRTHLRLVESETLPGAVKKGFDQIMHVIQIYDQDGHKGKDEGKVEEIRHREV